MLPTFDIEFSELDRSNFRAIGIRNSAGRIVGAHALRFFDWTGTSYGEEMTSYRLLYADPAKMKLDGERCDQLIKNGIANVRSRFSATKMAEEFEAVLREAVA